MSSKQALANQAAAACAKTAKHEQGGTNCKQPVCNGPAIVFFSYFLACIAATEQPIWIVLAYSIFVTVHSIPLCSVVPGLLCRVRRVHRVWDVAVVSPDHLVGR